MTEIALVLAAPLGLIVAGQFDGNPDAVQRTLIGLSLPFVLAGTLITEQVFNYPGMGLLFFNSAVSRDYPVLLGVIVVVGAATVLGSLLADVCYGILDPRVRYTRR